MMRRLKLLVKIIGKFDQNDFEIFIAWVTKILTRGVPEEKRKEIKEIIEKAALEEVSKMISNLEDKKVLSNSLFSSIPCSETPEHLQFPTREG